MIKINGTTITMPKGDTGLISFKVTGKDADGNDLVLTNSDRCVFCITDGTTDYAPKVVTPVNNVAAISLSNSDTESMDAGRYSWDMRVVIGAVIEDEVVTGGAEVHSPFAMGKLPKFVLTEVGPDV